MSLSVALVSEWLDPWRGGAETSTVQFLHHLMDAGIEVHLFTRSRLASAPRLHVHSIKVGRGPRWRVAKSFIAKIDARLKEGCFDVTHAISPCSHPDIYQPRGGTIAESIERNLVLRSTAAGRSLKRCANRFNLKQTRLLALERQLMTDPNGPMIIAISDYVRRQLKMHYGVPDQRIRLIYNGVNPDRSNPQQRLVDRRQIRSEYEIPDEALLVLQVAHNFRLKGVKTWIQAMTLLRATQGRQIRSLILGRGDSPAWHRLVQRKGISDVLTFVGPSDRIQSFYHAADVLVHPTYYDPCSRVVLEAMTAGLPCVTTRWDGAAEMIRNGENGFVLNDPADHESLAQTILRLMDAGVRERIGQAALAVRDRVDMKTHCSRILELYHALIQARSQA